MVRPSKLTVVVEELLDHVHVCEHHSAAAVPLQTQFVQGKTKISSFFLPFGRFGRVLDARELLLLHQREVVVPDVANNLWSAPNLLYRK